MSQRLKKSSLICGSILLLFLFALTSCAADDTRGNPAAHLLPGEFASEHWEFTAQFDSGYLLFAEFLITNIGLGDRNAAAFGHIVAPDGQTYRFTNGRREGNWNLSPDRLQIEIGASLLDLHDPAYHIQVNKHSVRVDLRFRPDGPAVWSEALSPPGYALDLLAAAVPVEGILWMKGMTEPVTVRGTLAATHSWMNEAGSSLVLRRLEFFALQESFPLYGVDLTTPKGRRIQWMVVKRQGKKEDESHTFELSLDGQTKEPRDPGYEVPGAFHLKNAEMEGQVRLEHVLVRNDPLADLPQPFHFLVALALDLRPRRVWALSPFEIVFPTDLPPAEHPPQHVRGTGVTAVTFLNPMPVSQPKAAARVSEISRVPQRPD